MESIADRVKNAADLAWHAAMGLFVVVGAPYIIVNLAIDHRSASAEASESFRRSAEELKMSVTQLPTNGSRARPLMYEFTPRSRPDQRCVAIVSGRQVSTQCFNNG